MTSIGSAEARLEHEVEIETFVKAALEDKIFENVLVDHIGNKLEYFDVFH